ncbi:MAG: hypothetical protein R3359_06450 [Marinirhabdus sp.]|nr:hypothetical protein [Marinirhabdus sp.]
MKQLLLLVLLLPYFAFGQNDFETRYFTISATVDTTFTTPELLAFQKKIAMLSNKKSRFSDFTDQQVTSQNFWQPIDMAATAQESPRPTVVSLERLQAGFGRTQLYGYQTDGRTNVRNEVYRDQSYYSPIFNPYGSYYRNRNYTPYGFRTPIRRTVITIGSDN